MNKIKPRLIGDEHLRDVALAVAGYCMNSSQPDSSIPSGATAKYIIEKYPNIRSVISKLDMENCDSHPDLTITLSDDCVVAVNLYKIKGKGNIQPKNLGAKSFLSTYFQSQKLQDDFNHEFERAYRKFLLSTAEIISGQSFESIDTKEIRSYIRNQTNSFTNEIEPFRERLLYHMREKCFLLLSNEYNEKSESIRNAFNELFMTDSVNIICRYKDNNEVIDVEEFKAEIDKIDEISVSKVGTYSLGITAEEHTLLIRFKFESGPSSSVKLATSFKVAQKTDEVKKGNLKSIATFNSTLGERLRKTSNKKDSDAIGKCSEAIFYYTVLQANSSLRRVDENKYIEMFEKYSVLVPNKDIENIIHTTAQTITKLQKYLEEKHGQYTIDSIELVPDSYIADRLDTADIELILRSNSKYIIEPISVKATALKTGKITSKNAGVGQIMGPTYFDMDQKALTALVSQLKEEYNKGAITHRDAQESVSSNIGKQLSDAPIEKLKGGVEALLGKALVVIVFYKVNSCLIHEHGSSISDIEVQRDTPTKIQNTIRWGNGSAEISIRVKFSAGQNKGWSSLKLACDYNYALS
ncbi:hypothetical protein LP316_02735 [Thalassotalea sp. LPB0316]|uniref:hypothetical protein n=1 Tax=Thalassotalea sp. LPB0316 TaxID=2769490 RepID=UPI0018669E62|nr:hypothetical protein [Thalassotalea sp. LPB0316]QOL26236.1 hypothetical protein LP316_02735 [Thalassotalea sp. LPB0316]